MGVETLDTVKALIALGVVRATFSIEGALTSFEVDTIPAPPPTEPETPAESPDDITAAANRLMGRK